jgi:hypothetical protein
MTVDPKTGRPIANLDRPSPAHAWHMEPSGTGITLRSARNRKYLSAPPNGTAEANRDRAQKWEIIESSDSDY